MDPEYALVIGVVLVGILVGGIVGIALGKWPARSTMRNVLRGALFGTGTVLVFIIFAVPRAFCRDRSFQWWGCELKLGKRKTELEQE